MKTFCKEFTVKAEKGINLELIKNIGDQGSYTLNATITEGSKERVIIYFPKALNRIRRELKTSDLPSYWYRIIENLLKQAK